MWYHVTWGWHDTFMVHAIITITIFIYPMFTWLVDYRKPIQGSIKGCSKTHGRPITVNVYIL